MPLQISPRNRTLNRYRRRMSQPAPTITITTERLKRLHSTSYDYYELKQQQKQQEYGAQLNAMLTDEALKAMDAIEYITQHLRRDNQHKKV